MKIVSFSYIKVKVLTEVRNLQKILQSVSTPATVSELCNSTQI